MQEQIENTLEVLNDLVHSHFRLAVHAIHKHNRNFANRVVHIVCANDDFHLENVASAFHTLHDIIKRFSLVQTVTTSQVANVRIEQDVSNEIRYARCEFSLEVPTKDTASRNIAGTSYHIIVMLFLLTNEFRHVFRLKLILDERINMMR